MQVTRSWNISLTRGQVDILFRVKGEQGYANPCDRLKACITSCPHKLGITRYLSNTSLQFSRKLFIPGYSTLTSNTTKDTSFLFFFFLSSFLPKHSCNSTRRQHDVLQIIFIRTSVIEKYLLFDCGFFITRCYFILF